MMRNIRNHLVQIFSSFISVKPEADAEIFLLSKHFSLNILHYSRS